ncbi:MAG TPA: aspartyl/asparaginyl beta-hydroxylase domain-containing protein [Polyangiaceae bacterium]|nr:aspartyl/asparaginyl beta-hydroxylase domain-containing protein [Polyangiaceae bacterium]
MFQRPHQRSPRALEKAYQFAWWPLEFDLAPLVEEIAQQRPDWLESQWKWHVEAHFSMLRTGQRSSYPGSELTNGHSINQPNLERLPQLCRFLDTAFPVEPTLAWLGSIPEGGRIFTHIDNTEHWDRHHRIHVPLITNPQARLCVARRFLFLQPKRIWLLNNSLPHGALNRGPERLHLVLDLPHFSGFDAWLAEANLESGEPDPAALAELDQNPLDSPATLSSLDSARLARLLSQ